MGTSVTVIVPTFNERENVAELVARTAVALAGYDAEILFVDDSTDSTAAEVERVAADAPLPVRVIHRTDNTGGLGERSPWASRPRHPISASSWTATCSIRPNCFLHWCAGTTKAMPMSWQPRATSAGAT